MAKQTHRDDAPWKVSRVLVMTARVEFVSMGVPKWYEEGYATTPHGVVGIYVQHDHTALRVVHEGRAYDRSWPRQITKRGIATLAGRFAREVTL